MKILILALLMLFAPTNTQSFDDENRLVGVFKVYITQNQDFHVEYEGMIDECFGRYLVIKLYPECDTSEVHRTLDSLINVGSAKVKDVDKPIRPTKGI